MSPQNEVLTGWSVQQRSRISRATPRTLFGFPACRESCGGYTLVRRARSAADLWLGRLTTGSDRFPHDTCGDVARAL